MERRSRVLRRFALICVLSLMRRFFCPRPWRASVASVVLSMFVVAMPNSYAQSPSSSDTTQVPEGFDLQGHRGARGVAPENTIPAFRRALESGVTTLEMDVVIAGDGTVVVSHEPWMARKKCRTASGERIRRGKQRSHNMYQMSYEEIEAYDCGSLKLSNFPEQEPTPASKPRLADVIQMAEAYTTEHERPPVFYNIETKSKPKWDNTFHPDPETFVERVLSVVAEQNVAPRTTVQSFDPRTLEAAHRRSGVIRTAFLVGWMGDDGLRNNLASLSFVPDIYSPNARLVDDDLVAAVHDRGMQVIPWTVNDPSTMKRLIQLGVDGLITDYPGRGQAVLQGIDP